MAAGGTSLNLFTEFVNITGPTYLTSAMDTVNDAQKTNYGTLGYMLRGQGMSDVLQGGAQIKDYIYLTAVRRARSYKPNAKQTYANPQTGTTWTADWRFFLTDMVWTDEEITLNAGGNMSADAKFQAYKDLYYRKQQQLYTDQMDYWEEIIWAEPDADEMEVNTGQEMFSIPCFITEGATIDNGFPVTSGTAWTTVAGISPTTETKWKNVLEQYGDGAAVGFRDDRRSLLPSQRTDGCPTKRPPIPERS